MHSSTDFSSPVDLLGYSIYVVATNMESTGCLDLARSALSPVRPGSPSGYRPDFPGIMDIYLE